MNNIFFKLIGAHFLITMITIVVMSLAINTITYFLVTLFSCILYFYSGYIVTKLKSNWLNYFGVFTIGIILWIICFALSTNSLNYKNDNEAGLWFIYQLYVMVKSPLNFIDFLNEPFNLKRELFILLLIPFIISVIQFSGGKLKIWKMKVDESES